MYINKVQSFPHHYHNRHSSYKNHFVNNHYYKICYPHYYPHCYPDYNYCYFYSPYKEYYDYSYYKNPNPNKNQKYKRKIKFNENFRFKINNKKIFYDNNNKCNFEHYNKSIKYAFPDNKNINQNNEGNKNKINSSSANSLQNYLNSHIFPSKLSPPNNSSPFFVSFGPYFLNSSKIPNKNDIYNIEKDNIEKYKVITASHHNLHQNNKNENKNTSGKNENKNPNITKPLLTFIFPKKIEENQNIRENNLENKKESCATKTLDSNIQYKYYPTFLYPPFYSPNVINNSHIHNFIPNACPVNNKSNNNSLNQNIKLTSKNNNENKNNEIPICQIFTKNSNQNIPSNNIENNSSLPKKNIIIKLNNNNFSFKQSYNNENFSNNNFTFDNNSTPLKINFNSEIKIDKKNLISKNLIENKNEKIKNEKFNNIKVSKLDKVNNESANPPNIVKQSSDIKYLNEYFDKEENIESNVIENVPDPHDTKNKNFLKKIKVLNKNSKKFKKSKYLSSDSNSNVKSADDTSDNPYKSLLDESNIIPRKKDKNEILIHFKCNNNKIIKNDTIVIGKTSFGDNINSSNTEPNDLNLISLCNNKNASTNKNKFQENKNKNLIFNNDKIIEYIKKIKNNKNKKKLI